MIRFNCPRCTSVLEAPDKLAGSKVACPKCQQRLQIPVPPPNKTILAPYLGHQTGAVPAPSSSPPPAASATDWRLNPPPASRGEVQSFAVAAVEMPQIPLVAPAPEMPAISERRRFRRPRLGCVVGMVAVLLGMTIVGLGIRLVSTGGYIRPAGQLPEDRPQARTDEEELVERYILNNADKDAGKVKFLTWGPHMDKGELLDLASEGGIVGMAQIFGLVDLDRTILLDFARPIRETSVRAIVRVRYEGPTTIQRKLVLFQFDADQTGRPRTYDHLFIVFDKRVFPWGKDDEGEDDWKQKLRKKLSKQFPGIKR